MSAPEEGNEASATKMSKRIWTPEEDAKMLTLIKAYDDKINWSEIASLMGDRTTKQCRERYGNHLHPDIKKGDWTEEEDQLIRRLAKEMNMQWAKIAKFLPGRTDNAVKNRWYTYTRSKASEADPDFIENALPLNKSAQKVHKKQPVIPKLCLEQVLPDVPLKFDLNNVYHNHHDADHELSYTSRSAPSPAQKITSVLSARLLKYSPRFPDIEHFDDVLEDLIMSGDDTAAYEVVPSPLSPLRQLAMNLDSFNFESFGPTGGMLLSARLDPDNVDLDGFDLDSLGLQSLQSYAGPNALFSKQPRFTPRLTPRSPSYISHSDKRQRGSLSARQLLSANSPGNAAAATSPGITNSIQQRTRSSFKNDTSG
jgi:hypothetical protein